MNLNIKKYVPFMLVLVAIVILSGTSYALLKSTSKGSNPYVMNVGVLEISFQDSEEDKLTLVNQIPISDEEGIDSEEEYEFTIKNTGTLPATYSVYIEETSTNPEFKSVIRYITSKNDGEYTDPKTLSEDKYIDTNATLGIDETATYKVKLWLSIDADSTYMNKTFTARIVVDTTLNYDGFNTSKTAEGLVEDNIINYATASASNFSGGLVAINTDGTLYNESDTTQTIREYRYSGTSVNNYIYFDTNGDGTKTDDEIWRIIGVFKNSAGEWNLKLMRNTILSADELPSTYIYDGTNYNISFVMSNVVFWNSSETNEDDDNDWTTAGLQYYLNGSDGYFGTLSSSAKVLIDVSYNYYLGNFNRETATSISSYIDERNSSNITYGNQELWSGAVGLLYPSDYGYSASSNYWNTVLNLYKDGAMDTSWIYLMDDFTYEFMISPALQNSILNTVIYTDGAVDYSVTASNYDESLGDYIGYVRPVLNLLSSTSIDTNHQGNETDPYVIVIE